MIAATAPEDRILARGTWALRAMWLLGILAPLVLAVQPFLFADLFLDPAPYQTEWGLTPHPSTIVAAAILGVAGLVIPLLWHRRAIERLLGSTRVTCVGFDPARAGRYREPPGFLHRPALPELAARAAVVRYASRLSIAMALVLPVDLFVWSAGSLVHFPESYPFRIVPRVESYLPLLALSALVLGFHAPTRRRVLGGLARIWA